MSYRTLERMGPEKEKAVKEDSTRFFKTLESDEIV